MAEIKDNSTGRNKLEQEIRALMNIEMPERPEIERTVLSEIEYNAPTDAELEQAAQASLSEYKRDNEAAIRSDSAENEKKLQAEKIGYSDAMRREKEELDSVYKTAGDDIDSDVIRRGLARSTVAANAKSELSAAYAKKAAEIGTEYGKKIADIDKEIAAVGSKLQSALNDFNLSYAAKLTEKLSELKAERADKALQAEKYNNEIKVKQAALDAQRAKTESDLYDAEIARMGKEGVLFDDLSTEKRDAIYKSIYIKADEFLSSMSADEARQEIRNHKLYRDYLSDYYYFKLYDKYAR